MYNKTLPLVDLHRHLDGNIPPHLIWKLAQQYSIELPVKTEAELIGLALVKDKTSNLLDFLQKLEYGVSILASPEVCYQVAYENVLMAKNEGLDYTELRFSPYFMAKAFDLPLAAVVEAVVAGVKAGNQSAQTKYQLIGILSRTFGVEACHKELASILAFSDDIVGLDLAGDELNYPASMFSEHFKMARDANMHITVHAGEAAGPESVWDAINLLGASRIGHGIAITQDPKLIDYMQKHNIAVESCLTSNYQTGTWTNFANHPIKTFLDNGLSVSLNTDDPGVSNINIQHEYEIAANEVGLTPSQIATIQENGVKQQFSKS